MVTLKYSKNGFEGNAEELNSETNPIVEIQCEYQSCKLMDANTMYNQACKYIETFLNNKTISTWNVVPDLHINSSCDEIIYVEKVMLQVTIG